MGNRIRFVCRFFSGRKNLFSLFFFSPLSENVFVVHWHVEKHTPEERWTDGGLIPSGSASSLRIWWERKIYERFMERDFFLWRLLRDDFRETLSTGWFTHTNTWLKNITLQPLMEVILEANQIAQQTLLRTIIHQKKEGKYIPGREKSIIEGKVLSSILFFSSTFSLEIFTQSFCERDFCTKKWN